MSFFGEVGRATRRSFELMRESRQRQAQRYVNSVLLQMDDETLRRAGYSRRELEASGRATYPF